MEMTLKRAKWGKGVKLVSKLEGGRQRKTWERCLLVTVGYVEL
jgi:hypothetical protein